MAAIKVYGADWCEDTQETRQHLDRLSIPYQYIDIDADPQAEAWITRQNNGKRQTPTVDVNGKILIEPSNDELDEAVRSIAS